ncbi:hypothetical protein [Nostoc sp. 'Lobaria pulmonaria (5183) cyanobiont']|uniref:hypothetical protein n=1 Tax=Nostoc sp. 'Lobaria pulmonaria (5183) cyanobiont' TaxID=1618022 RepID=UPI001319BD92|nr:hypothetical protein [Nostoc sp. 'Lobaria pulmonaria (5183) cyanobiont']
MKESYTNNPEELELHLRPCAIETVSIKIPTDTLRSLEKVADNRDISPQALLKLSKSRQL